MKYLIDGHNLIGRLPDISLADPNDEIKLIRLVARWRWRHNSPSVTIVFDPGDFAVHGRRRIKRSGIRVRYAPHSSNADAVLLRLIEKSRQPTQLTVVSSDREIRSAAQRVGAHVLSAEEFAVKLVTPAAPDEETAQQHEPLSAEEVKVWLKIFQNRDNQ